MKLEDHKAQQSIIIKKEEYNAEWKKKAKKLKKIVNLLPSQSGYGANKFMRVMFGACGM